MALNCKIDKIIQMGKAIMEFMLSCLAERLSVSDSGEGHNAQEYVDLLKLVILTTFMVHTNMRK